MMLSWHSLLSKLVILDFDFGCPRLRQYTSNRRCGSRRMDAPTPVHVGLAVWTLDFGARLKRRRGELQVMVNGKAGATGSPATCRQGRIYFLERRPLSHWLRSSSA